MAAVSAQIPDQMKMPDTSEDDEPSSPSPDDQIHSSPFSIHNVLKKERESPENVFSTDKLLQSTPSFDASNPNSPRLDDTEISVDCDSCSSNDTVLSVGNEAPVQEISFKHIQTHLNAISQLSHFNPPLLLRPNPIPMFLNQPFYPSHLKYPKDSECFRRAEERERTMDGRQEERDFINPNLKFSIDNILKADFGRRITDPLIRKKRTDGKKEEIPEANVEPRLEGRPEVKDKGAIDLSKADDSPASSGGTSSDGPMVWPAWVYCTRYSDRPSSGPRTRKPKKPPGDTNSDEKRPRTAFSGPQLARLKHEFAENRYLTERRRQALAAELGLAEAQIKIWFQNKRAKIKKASGHRNPLALQLMAQGLYNHSTIPLTKEEEELEMKAREREQARQ